MSNEFRPPITSFTMTTPIDYVCMGFGRVLLMFLFPPGPFATVLVTDFRGKHYNVPTVVAPGMTHNDTILKCWNNQEGAFKSTCDRFLALDPESRAIYEVSVEAVRETLKRNNIQ